MHRSFLLHRTRKEIIAQIKQTAESFENWEFAGLISFCKLDII